MKTSFAIALALALGSCGGVPRTDAPCIHDFRNGTQGVLTDAELASAWSRAQHMIADGKWVINALSCSNPNIPCVTHAPEPKALTVTPKCLSVKGIHGQVDSEGHEGEQLGNAIAIDIDLSHQMVWNFASYEMENVIGEKLGFDEGDR